jgi:DNA-binding transcriptional ArsR family regulator
MFGRQLEGETLPVPPAPSSPVPADDDLEVAVAALRFLSDSNRLRLLKALERQQLYVFELMELLGLPQPLVSFHLRRLRQAGLVQSRRMGQRVYYTIDVNAWNSFTAPIRALCDVLEPLPTEARGGDETSGIDRVDIPRGDTISSMQID